MTTKAKCWLCAIAVMWNLILLPMSCEKSTPVVPIECGCGEAEQKAMRDKQKAWQKMQVETQKRIAL